MKIYIRSANASEVRWAVSGGIADGVIVDPALAALEEPDTEYAEHLAALARATSGLVHADVIAVDPETMYHEGRELARLADNIVVRIPFIDEGIAATRRLVSDGTRVATTFVFTPGQALIAAKAGATYACVDVTALAEAGMDAHNLLDDMREIFDRYDFDCELIATGVRTPAEFTWAALVGADGVELPLSVLRVVITHPLTDRALDRALNEWSRHRPREHGI